MNNNIFQIKNALTFPNKNLKIKKMLLNTTEIQTVWDNCLGYSALQLSVRTANDIILHIDYSDDHINNSLLIKAQYSMSSHYILC